MKNVEYPVPHNEKLAELEHAQTIDKPSPTSDDIVGTILLRNSKTKQLLATQLAAIGLSENIISRLLNIKPKSSENEEKE